VFSPSSVYGASKCSVCFRSLIIPKSMVIHACSPTHTIFLNLVSRVRQGLLQAANRSRDVRSLWVCYADTHVSKSNILGRDLLVQSTSEDDTLLQQVGENIRRRDAFGQIDGSHAVGLVLRLACELLEAEVSNGFLNLLGRGLVVGEALVEWAR
jgi:hypothetical protein